MLMHRVKTSYKITSDISKVIARKYNSLVIAKISYKVKLNQGVLKKPKDYNIVAT